MKCISLDCSNEGTLLIEGERVCPSCADLARQLADIVIEDKLLPPNPGSIRCPLSAVKGVGVGVAEYIAQEKAARGPFRSLGDFANRIDPALFTKAVLSQLTYAGTFDEFEPNRAMVIENLDQIISAAKRQRDTKQSGRIDIFDDIF